MKKILLILPFIAVCACSNPKSDKKIPPAPKPDNYIDTIAVAAKKADFYVRLAFDLADGYLYDNSVVRKRYGTDSKYVDSLEFGLSDTNGIVMTSHISGPEFKYWRQDQHGTPEVVISSSINNPNYYNNTVKRAAYLAQMAGTVYRSYQYDIKFRKTDVVGEQIDMSITFTDPGQFTAKGASMTMPAFIINVQDFSGAFKPFNVVVLNVSGEIKGVQGTGSGYVPSAKSEFVIKGGKILVTGTDLSVTPAVAYTIELDYSDDIVANKTGNFTSSDAKFLANYTITKDEAYYSITSNQKRYVYWDYPL
ncbi:MAG: hypothetical protein FWH43_06065 [Endomicrobia bacterium]|nr:hypothetical protein [Endomicrobiia bacterium]